MTTQTTRTTRRTDVRELNWHRELFHRNKLCGPLLRWSDLTVDAQGMLTRHFIAKSRDVSGPPITRLYVEILHSWGVMCPHPLSYRLYDGWRASDYAIPAEDSRWFSCGMCGTAVVNLAA